MNAPPKLLADTPRWLTWRPQDGTKLPTSPRTGAVVSAYDPEHHTNWDAVANAERPAFFFQRQGGLFGVDLDGCLVPNWLAPWAAEIVNRFNTYTEVSPSGTGLKLYCAGQCDVKKAKKIGGTVQGKKSGVEVHGYGFFCYTGRPWVASQEVVNCDAALSWLLSKYWPVALALPAMQPVNDIEKRVVRYLEKCDPAISGQGGHNRTFAVAGALIHGFQLSTTAALPLFQSWNAKCKPPWSDKELERKLNQASVAPCNKPPGWLLNEGAVTVDTLTPDVDLSQFEVEPEPVKPGQSRGDPGEIPQAVFDALPGLIGDIVRFNLQSAGKPQPELALAAALCLLGSVFGRKIKDRRGTRTNLYAMGVLISTGGKDHARTVNKKILALAGADTLIGAENFASDAGFVRQVERAPSVLFQLDECSDLMESINSSGDQHLRSIGTELLRMYTSSHTKYMGKAHVDPKNDINIPFPCCSLYCTTTPGIWGKVNTANVDQGLLGRFLVFEGRRDSPEQDVEEQDPTDDIAERVRAWRKFNDMADLPGMEGNPVVVEYTPEARARMLEHRAGIESRKKKEEEMHGVVWGRTAEKTAKLALIFAASRISDPEKQIPVVSIEDANLAVGISNHSTRKLLYSITEKVSENRQEADIKRVLSMVPFPPVCINRSTLMRKLRFLGGYANQMVQNLILAGEIETVETERNGPGAPVTRYQRIPG